MEKSFWENRWNTGAIGFHGKINNYLTKYIDQLKLEKGSRVLVPLCGKTLDIHWLLAQGYHVVGAEFVELAVAELFQELGVTPTIKNEGALKHYSGPSIDIFVGDIFHVSSNLAGKIDAIYDRAALVALPLESRIKYTQHLMAITNKAKQLLITYEYDQSKFDGPPFSITASEVKKHYSENYTVKALETVFLPQNLRGQQDAEETAWLID